MEFSIFPFSLMVRISKNLHYFAAHAREVRELHILIVIFQFCNRFYKVSHLLKGLKSENLSSLASLARKIFLCLKCILGPPPEKNFLTTPLFIVSLRFTVRLKRFADFSLESFPLMNFHKIKSFQ